MTHIQILLPFGLPPAHMATDLVRALNTPSLSTIIARAKSSGHEVFEDFSRALPHELCLAYQFGLANRTPNSSSPTIAIAAMHALGLKPAAGTWFIVNPVHIHVARDHLVLTDQRQLTLSEEESRSLFDAAKPYFDEAGKPLLYGDAHTWFVHADDWTDLETSTPDAACGHNIDIWMPKGDNALQWRKLQNEIQMLWHTHRINEERESQSQKPVNSLWLWGGAHLADSEAQSTVINHYSATFNLAGWNGAFAQFPRNAQNCTAADVIAAAPKHGLLILDQLIGPALANDWSTWLMQMHALENDWFTPLLNAIKNGKLDQLSLILTHSAGLSEFTVTKNSLRKFWIKPSLARLRP